MTKSELQTGDIVEYKKRDFGGKFAVVMLDTRNGSRIVGRNSYTPLDSFAEDLTMPSNDRFEIVAVFTPSNVNIRPSVDSVKTCLWKREEKITVRGKEYSESTLVNALKDYIG